ncbi:MAG TPA: hypothetical protein VJI46_05510 [Candidatus Nanoarchaeia archaeon]|nr:hypothetical protein [Candidatus Nanoarchaeia archaeon]
MGEQELRKELSDALVPLYKKLGKYRSEEAAGSEYRCREFNGKFEVLRLRGMFCEFLGGEAFSPSLEVRVDIEPADKRIGRVVNNIYQDYWESLKDALSFATAESVEKEFKREYGFLTFKMDGSRGYARFLELQNSSEAKEEDYARMTNVANWFNREVLWRFFDGIKPRGAYIQVPSESICETLPLIEDSRIILRPDNIVRVVLGSYSLHFVYKDTGAKSDIVLKFSAGGKRRLYLKHWPVRGNVRSLSVKSVSPDSAFVRILAGFEAAGRK